LLKINAPESNSQKRLNNEHEIASEPYSLEENAGPPPLPSNLSKDERYFLLIQTALRKCLEYKPKFGKGRKEGFSLEQFTALYSADPFYHWFGIDSPLMYAAHKAAGGMTSIYRQIGIGGQWVFYQILQDHLGLNREQAIWSYKIEGTQGKQRTLTLDGRIALGDVKSADARARIRNWLSEVASQIRLPDDTLENIKGIVFETRQGYKSKDSKRQNADIANASKAYANLYVPVLLLFSTQIDGDVAQRYRENFWVLLTGTLSGAATASAYSFCREIVGYDLADFFTRHSPNIKGEVENVLKTLLST
jgi:hypothetical protein